MRCHQISHVSHSPNPTSVVQDQCQYMRGHITVICSTVYNIMRHKCGISNVGFASLVPVLIPQQ